MILSMILARSLDDVIGIGDKLPWQCPAELKHFKELTTGPNKAVVMGSTTWNGLPVRPLPGRVNFVLSTDPIKLQTRGMEGLAFWETSIDTVIEKAKAVGIEELIFIGGKKVYEQVLDRVDVVYLSEMNVMVGDNQPDLVLFDHHFASYVRDDRQEWRVETEYTVYDSETGHSLFDYTKLVRL
jgi:dihydrofolate reductase